MQYPGRREYDLSMIEYSRMNMFLSSVLLKRKIGVAQKVVTAGVNVKMF